MKTEKARDSSPIKVARNSIPTLVPGEIENVHDSKDKVELSERKS